MSIKSPVYLFVILIFLCSSVISQDAPVFRVSKLTDQIYQLNSDEGNYTTNVLVFVGKDGVLLVDSNTEANADELKRLVDSLVGEIPRYIINTHRHVEHIGGNAVFGDTPVVIAHELVPMKLKSGGYIFDEFPEATYPDITLTDSLTLYFNGEKIRLIAMGGSHDDNEIIVHFTKSKIVHLSSLVNGLNFPSVDSDGNVLKFAELVSKAIELLPEDVTIVSGHNNNCHWQDLHNYKDMILKTTAIVKAGLDAGKDVETMQTEKVLDGWEAYEKSYVSKDDWIKYIVKGYEEKDTRKKIYEPLYYALKDGGPEAAVEKYNDLKKNHPDEYIFEEVYLLIIGDKLLNKKKYPEAAGILKLCLSEFPEGDYGYYVNYDLSLALKESGDIKSAIRHCEKSIELKPDFQAGAKLLEELKKL